MRLQLPEHGVRIAERNGKSRVLLFELCHVGCRQRQTPMGTEQDRNLSTPDPLGQPAGSASSGGESGYPRLPPAPAVRCDSAPASPPSLLDPEQTEPCSSRLLPIQYPRPCRNPRILSIVRRRLTNTNHCPLAGSSPRDRRTRADNPSNEHRMSVGWVQQPDSTRPETVQHDAARRSRSTTPAPSSSSTSHALGPDEVGEVRVCARLVSSTNSASGEASPRPAAGVARSLRRHRSKCAQRQSVRGAEFSPRL